MWHEIVEVKWSEAVRQVQYVVQENKKFTTANVRKSYNIDYMDYGIRDEGLFCVAYLGVVCLHAAPWIQLFASMAT